MPIEVTDEAVAVLRQSLELARVDARVGGARLHAARALGGGLNVQVELADAAAPDEDVVEAGGIRIFIDPSLSAALSGLVVAVEQPHGRLIVRPAAP
ncbi:MAG: iron-sulfur cluster biosynthesis family protein [Actinomycetota bacterium]|nr:iron-sulfur cluster biosynthesis family protein [Actinomycetota bacterium]